MSITIHTGFQGDRNHIVIDWYDHNNVRQQTIIDANILDQDKPRTLQISIDEKVVATIDSGTITFRKEP